MFEIVLKIPIIYFNYIDCATSISVNFFHNTSIIIYKT